MRKAGARRGRGRPARLSREAIVEAARDLLEREPDRPVGVARIAAAVDAVPAALYRHFGSLEELLDAVLAEVLSAVEPGIRRDAPWPEQLRDWMTALRDHLLRYPAVLPLIGRRGRTSPAWLSVASIPIGILERAGLEGAELARAHLWVVEATTGVVMLEASLPLPDQIRNARASLDELSDEARDRYDPLVPHLTGLDGDAFFRFVVDRTLDALGVLVEGR